MSLVITKETAVRIIIIGVAFKTVNLATQAITKIAGDGHVGFESTINEKGTATYTIFVDPNKMEGKTKREIDKVIEKVHGLTANKHSIEIEYPGIEGRIVA